MKKILVVFTGGTIGSSVSGNRIDTAKESRSLLLKLYHERYGRSAQVEFLHIAPVEILSENLVPAVWTQILLAVDAYDKHSLAGIIITHGTDTLAFSAAAFGYYYAGLNMPLVLVSSDYPLTDARANGLDNFDAAVALILERSAYGVFVAYRNQGENTQIHLGTRLASCLQLSSQFISVQSKEYCQFADDHFSLLHKPTLPRQSWALKPQFSTRVLLIRPYPGLDYTAVSLQGVDAVLHDLYHSGTACATNAWGGQYSLVAFIQRCKQAGVKMYLAPGVSTFSVYSSTQALLEEGAEMLWNISIEAAFVKLLLAYGNFEAPHLRQTFLQQNIAHEILELNYI